MYERKSRPKPREPAKLIEYFVAGKKLPSYVFSSDVEADESYFGGVRKGKRGRGARGRIAVFGFPKRGGKVYTPIIPDAITETLTHY